jgi:DNA polymerase III subunit gamma/tau
MLSSQAWNAFLKTLEEPPPHTIFVLATTEAQKVLPTVVDRCHRFDFGRPSVEQLAAVVRRVAGEENIEIAPDAVALLARHATGSFRDALGTLEQLVTYSGPSIAMEDVLAVLGVADADLLFSTLDAVAAHDPRAALHAAAAMADTGRDLGQFARDLEAHARDVLVVQTLGEVPAELRLTPDRDARLAEQAGRIGGSDVVRLLDLLAAAMRAVKDGASARTQLELALVKAAAPEVDPAARALMARIERLEGRATGAATPVAEPAAPAPAAAPAAPVPEPEAPPAPATHPPEAAAELHFDAVAALWPSVLDAVRSENGLLGACLSEARPVELRGRELVVAFAEGDGFNRKLAEGLANRAALEAAVRDLAGGALRVAFELRDLGDGAAVVDRPQSEDELMARLMAEFDAEEIVPDPDHQRGEA